MSEANYKEPIDYGNYARDYTEDEEPCDTCRGFGGFNDDSTCMDCGGIGFYALG